MQNRGSIKSSDRLYFSSEVVFRNCAEGWLAVSVETANWIVLHSDFQKFLLEEFLKGKTVAEVTEVVGSEDQVSDLKKLLASIFARDFARTDGAPRPQFLEGHKMLNCYLTNACNLRCKHCFMRSGAKLANELSVGEWKTVLSDFSLSGGTDVTFTGGEPLMNSEFSELVKFANSLRLKVTVLSNGLLWTPEMIADLVPFISEVQISIDGFDENTNAAVRGFGHFTKVVETVIALANAGCRISVATTFTFDNLGKDTMVSYKKMVDEIKSRCENPVFFKLSKKILPGRETKYSDAENCRFLERISEIEKFVDPNAQFANFMEGHTPNLAARNCGFGGLSIGADGEAYFCNRIFEVQSYGNVRRTYVKDLMKIGYQLHIDTGVENVIPCKKCHLRYICTGGCRIDEFNFNGKLQDFVGEYMQIECSEENKKRLERKMIESFKYSYGF